MSTFHHSRFQCFLAIRKQSMNRAMRFVADSVNLLGKLLPRSCRVLIEERLNPAVVLIEQRQSPLPLSPI
jgi:hypothetical protein